MDSKRRPNSCAGIGCDDFRTCGLQACGGRQDHAGSIAQTFRAIAAIAMVSSMLLACSPASNDSGAPAAAPQETKAVAPPDPAQLAARLQECRAKLEAGIPLGLVNNASFDNGRPVLWVGPAWKKSTTETKESLAHDAACFFLSGDESKTIKFSIYEQATDREVAVWDSSRLVEW